MNEKFKLAFLIFASICTGIDIAKGEWILALCCILYPLYYLFNKD